MPTTVTKSIGTASRDYSTIQLWEDALPANLVTGDTVQIGQCYNDAEFLVAGTVVTFSGSTTDSTHYIELQCGTGQSFRDNANVQTNALRYNQSNGVGIRCSAGYSAAIDISENDIRLTGLQVANTGGNGSWGVNGHQADTRARFTYCIFESNSQSGTQGVVYDCALGESWNCLIVSRAVSHNGYATGYPSGATLYNCTIVRPSDVTNTGSATRIGGSGTITLQNCAMFGFASLASGGTLAGSNNCSDLAISFGTNNQASKTYANQFVTTTDASRDFRLKSGADCVDNGVTDATHAANDIAGTARPSGSAYDISCWELVAAAAGGPSPFAFTLLGIQ